MHEKLIRAFQKRQIGEYDAAASFSAQEVRSLQEDAASFLSSAKRTMPGL